MDQFEDAPKDAFVSDEGWLVYGDEAWELSEWNSTAPDRRPRDRPSKYKKRVSHAHA